MPELTRGEKLKIFEKLPKELQNLMQSEDTGAFLLYLGEKYNLDDEKTSSLSKIVGDAILGIMPATSLAQEINLKITPDTQTAMSLAQELYTNLLATVTVPQKPVPQPVIPQMPVPTPTAPADQYREPMREAPEIIDLRKTPPPPMQMPVAAAPAYIPEGISAGKPIPPPTPKVGAPTSPQANVGAVLRPISPLTFTKPVEPPVKIEPPVVSKIEPIKPIPLTPLIEAEPHKVAPPLVTSPQPLAPEIKAPEMLRPPVVSQFEPQFIIRPPGLAPTDLPHDVLDLRKDKGEF